MRATFVIIVAMASGSLLWFWLRPDSRSSISSGHDPTKLRHEDALARHALRSNEPDRDETGDLVVSDGGSKTAVAGGELAVEDEALLTMYEELAAAFERPNQKCAALALSISQVIGQHEASVRAWVAINASRKDSAQTAARTKLEQVAGARIERVRQAMRVGLGRCASEQSVVLALRRLAEMNATL